VTGKDLTSLFDLDSPESSEPVLVSALDSPQSDFSPIQETPSIKFNAPDLGNDLDSSPSADLPPADLPPPDAPMELPSPEPASSEPPAIDLSARPSANTDLEFSPPPPAPEPETYTPEPTPAPEPPASTTQRTAAKPSIPKTSEAFDIRAASVAATVQAAYPFSLRIDGHLKPAEREKLVDLLARENMGIREFDLEVQFESGKVLIPRISEYAGVLIVQALRGISAEITLGPSDSIFSTPDTHESSDDTIQRPASKLVIESSHFDHSSKVEAAAEKIAITHLQTLPGMPQFEAVDAVVASCAIRTSAVEANKSTEYSEAIEALKRELRYRAHHRGATAIIGFEVKLTSLSLPTHYRITITGTAIKPAEKK
jgi:uncharacterized protein YbjQ (UPF0145 family)